MATLKTLLSNLSILKDLEKIIWLPDSKQQKLTKINDEVTEYEKSINPLLQGNMHDLIFAYNKLKNVKLGLETISVEERAIWKKAYKERKERAKTYYDMVLTDDMNNVNSDIVTMIREITLEDEQLKEEMAKIERNLKKILEDEKILEDSEASGGGRRRTNKKRSTRRKKKRGKRTRNYRTKR
jgi:hypothetical protein